MAIGDCYQLTVNSTVSGKDCNNIFYYAEVTDPLSNPAAIAQGLCDQFFTVIYSPLWKPFLSNIAILRNIFAYRIWPAVADGQGRAYASEDGGVAGDPIPNGSTALISMRTPNDAQNFWRRTYISGIPESSTTKSFLNQSVVEDLRDLAFALSSTPLVAPPMGFGTYRPVAYSKKLAAASASVVHLPLTRFDVKKNIRSQRQRNIVSG